MAGLPLVFAATKGQSASRLTVPVSRPPRAPPRHCPSPSAFCGITAETDLLLSLARAPCRHAELTGTLLAYALCLANQASSLVASLGSYEISASVSSAAIGVHDETINSAADTLCRASGVLMHLAETVVPRWEAAVGTEALRQRPVEMTREVTTALAKCVLRDGVTI